MSFLYSLLVTVAALLAAPWYIVRYGLRGMPRGYWSERLGRLPARLREPSGAGAIWIHAVSVGETLAIAGLAHELQRRFTARPLYLSHVTPTGRAAGEARVPGAAGRFYLPLDWAWAARRVLDRLHPAVLIIAETELWPNLLREAHARGTRVTLVNARLSESSYRGYLRFGTFFKRAAAAIDRVFAQTEDDAGRFRGLGVPADRVTVAGNMKFDGRPPELEEMPRRIGRALSAAGRAPVLVAGSTMEGEERLVLRAWARIRERSPRALLVIAPRHPQRFNAVAQALEAERRAFVRRTALGSAAPGARLDEAEILLLDTLGELAGMYELADLAFVGGSLVKAGGHNLLEPAYWAKPVIFGPHMENFRDAAALFVSEGAGLQVRSAEELAADAVALFEDAPRCQEMGRRGRRLLERESGATLRVADALEKWLGAHETPEPAVTGSRAL